MSRGRKPSKRVRIEIELDMTNAAYQELKVNLKSNIEAAIGGTLVYLAIGAEDRNS